MKRSVVLSLFALVLEVTWNPFS